MTAYTYEINTTVFIMLLQLLRKLEFDDNNIVIKGIKICYLFKKLRTCNNMTKTIAFTL